jgi:hypothetical protein
VTPVKKPKDFIVYYLVWRKNLLQFLKFRSPPRRNSSRKIGTVTGKTRNPKNEAERQLRFSQLVAPLQKLGEVFVLQPVMNKNLFRFFKFHLVFPESASQDEVSNRQKMGGFEKLGESGFLGKGGIPDPP